MEVVCSICAVAAKQREWMRQMRCWAGLFHLDCGVPAELAGLGWAARKSVAGLLRV